MVCSSSWKVEDRKIKKPYLGGWRHKITNLEYLNAESQTGPLRMSKKEMCSKMVQYITTTEVSTQTPCNHPTQMWRPDCFITSEMDKCLTSQPYETYEEMMLRLDYDGNARIIQRNYRIYLLWKNIKKFAKEYRDLVKDCEMYEYQKWMIYRKRHQQEIVRRINPQTRLDFDMLYDLVERWKRDRLECTKHRFFKAARCAENCVILEKVMEMFRVIDQKRQQVKKRYRLKKRVKFITVNCKPVAWHGYKGRLTEVDTMRNQKARELKMIYDSLMKYDVTRGERIEILTMLKKSLETHVCVAAINLIRHLDQELHYLTKGIRGMSLEYFRDRIAYDFLSFVRASHSCCCVNDDENFCKNVHDEKLREPIEKNTKLCSGCSKLQPSYKFTVHGRIKKLTACVECTWLRERGTAHVNYDPYLFILNCIRCEERKKCSPSAITFVMQKYDMYHLVNHIWQGRSAVSENVNLFSLRMIRFNVDEEWSPWNCILLTEEEAEVHTRIKDPSSMYSKYFIERILLRHQSAKNQFKRMKQFEEEFREAFHKIDHKVVYKPAIKVDDYQFT